MTLTQHFVTDGLNRQSNADRFDGCFVMEHPKTLKVEILVRHVSFQPANPQQHNDICSKILYRGDACSIDWRWLATSLAVAAQNASGY